MHAHVSYLTDDCPACLFMLTVERDAFFELSEAKKKIVAVSSSFSQLLSSNIGGKSYKRVAVSFSQFQVLFNWSSDNTELNICSSNFHTIGYQTILIS